MRIRTRLERERLAEETRCFTVSMFSEQGSAVFDQGCGPLVPFPFPLTLCELSAELAHRVLCIDIVRRYGQRLVQGCNCFVEQTSTFEIPGVGEALFNNSIYSLLLFGGSGSLRFLNEFTIFIQFRARCLGLCNGSQFRLGLERL